MSGGRWNYQGYLLDEILANVGNDPDVIKMCPKLAELLAELGPALAHVEHDLDWHVSGDTEIKDSVLFEKLVIAKILVLTLKSAPDEWFPRGKWATIQAIQRRIP